MQQYILTLACRDVMGIVARVATFLAHAQCFILESGQFGDATTGRFFMRTHFESRSGATLEQLQQAFAPIAQEFGMEWQLTDPALRPRLLLMVSKQGHCLSHLLHRYQSGALPVQIAAVVSNHTDLQELVGWYRIPFHHLPITAETKLQQETQLMHLVDSLQIDLVVLARYMQILSQDLCRRLSGRAINIHHSFLPSFKGAKPYHQAFDRGVKLIGATAHYVTPDLDEGPIIEQEVVRVDHAHSPEELVALGWDIESQVLAHAVKYQIERRVLLNGNKTVIFK
jgi:formyltetrahydrofolate deformylase